MSDVAQHSPSPCCLCTPCIHEQAVSIRRLQDLEALWHFARICSCACVPLLHRSITSSLLVGFSPRSGSDCRTLSKTRGASVPFALQLTLLHAGCAERQCRRCLRLWAPLESVLSHSGLCPALNRGTTTPSSDPKLTCPPACCLCEIHQLARALSAEAQGSRVASSCVQRGRQLKLLVWQLVLWA